MQPRTRRAASQAAAVIAVLVALFAVYQLYITGNAVLAAACAGGFGLAIFVYTARGMYTYRYLFPGLAAIAIFIVLPLVYTVWIGLTNYSSKNLLTFERATEILLGEVYQQSDVRYQFTLHAARPGFRLVLHTDAAVPPTDAAATPAGGAAPAM
ncbi:MAG TPA: hypothetical protein VIX73_13555, partial [Kofleriaceae bacterium]